MAITFTGTGGIFNRLGFVQGHADTVISDKPDDAQTKLKELETVARDMLIRTVNNDNPIPCLCKGSALDEFIVQMNATSATVDASTATHSVSLATTNTGDGTLIVSLNNPSDADWQTVRSEDIVLECVTDAQRGLLNIIAGAELFTVKGEVSVPNTDPNWPKGSGMSATIKCATAAEDALSVDGGNVLTNSAFEEFTSNDPDQWDIRVGAAGSEVLETSTKYKGTNALDFLSDGATLTQISQAISAATGTNGRVVPSSKYLISFRIRHGGSSATAGLLSVALRDGGGINAVVGTAVTVDLTTVGGTYELKSQVLSTPADLPASVEFDIRLTIATPSGVSMFMDQFVCQRMHQPQTSGPYFGLIDGAIDWIGKGPTADGDKIFVTVTNNNEGQFVRHFDRDYDMYGMGKQLPSSATGGETIDDSLVQ